MKTLLLSADQIKNLSKQLPGWEVKGASINRAYKFKNFVEAFAFMTQVAFIAEKINHHPDWENTYNVVKIKLTTHDLGGLTNIDIKMANSINEIA
tara:strand:- start:443 stop:727 length:285 start_codon:yes stop_codon:yes gene_type:complete